MTLHIRLRAAAGLAAAVLTLLPACSLLRKPEAARAMDAGKKYLAKKDYTRAILEFKNAARAKPGDAEAYYQLGLAYLGAGDWNLAGVCLTRATEINPQHYDAQIKLAELMATTEDRAILEEAKRRLEQTLAARPNDVETLTSLAVTEWKLARPGDAEAHLRQAFLKDPKRLDSALALVKMKLDRKDVAGAEEVMRQMVAQQPNSPGALVAMGEFYYALGRAADGEAQIRRAHQVDPNHGPALLDLAAIEVRAGNLAAAEALYRRLSSLPGPEYRHYHALFLLETGKTDDGVAELRALSAKYPDDRRVRSALVTGLVMARRLPDATAVLTAALKKNSKDVDALLQRGSLNLDARKYRQAEEDFSAVLRFRPDFAEAHFLLGKVHNGRGNALSERQAYAEALRRRPDFLTARLDLAALLIRSGGAGSALGVLDEAPANQKEIPALLAQRGWALLGMERDADARKLVDAAMARGWKGDFLLQDAALKARQRKFDEARKALREHLVTAPDDVRALELLVRSYVAQNQAAAAVREVRSHAESRRQSVAVQLFLGKLLLEAGESKAAREAFQQAKSLDPGLIIADLSMVQADIKSGRLDEARRALGDLIQTNGEHATARLWLGHLDEMAGNHSGAMEHYRRVLAIDGDNVNALNNYAYLMAETGTQFDEALKYAQRAAELDPTGAATQNTLGWVLYRKGLFDAAARHLQQAVDRQPTARRAAHLAMAYAKLGDERRSRASLQTAQRLDPKIPEVRQAAQMLGETANAPR